MAGRQRLTEITRGLQHAAQTTLSVVAEQFIQLMEQFFDAMPDGTMKAKVVRVQIDENSYVMVPLVALVTPRGLSLDRMRVNLSVRLEETEATKATSDWDNSDLTRTSFHVTMAPRGGSGERRGGDTLDVELEFKASDPPESVMRLVDMFANVVSPFTPKGELPPMPYTNTKVFRELLARGRERGNGTTEETPPPAR